MSPALSPETWFSIAKVVAPVVLALIPGVPPVLIPAITKLIEVAEASGKSGVVKKEIVLEGVQVAVETTNAVTAGPPINPQHAVDAVGQGIDAVISTINLVEEIQAKVTHQDTPGAIDEP